MKSAISLLASVLFYQQVDAKFKKHTDKKPHHPKDDSNHINFDFGDLGDEIQKIINEENIEKIEKVAVDTVVDQTIGTIVPGGGATIEIAKQLVEHLINNKGDSMVDEVKQIAEQQAINAISDKVSESDLETMRIAMEIPMISDKINEIAKNVSDGKIDSEAIKNFLDQIVQ